MHRAKSSPALVIALSAAIALFACDGGPTAPDPTPPPTPPILVSVALAPDTISVATDSAVVGALAAGRSATGLDSLVISITGPSAADTLTCRSSTPTGGTRENGVWLCLLAVPAGAEPGTWRTSRVGLYSTQQASGSRVWTGAELATNGLGAALEILAPPPPATRVYRWINPAGGAFENGTNWNRGVAPSAGDSAFIDVANMDPFVITLNSDVSLARLTIGGPGSQPSLNIDGAVLTVSDSLLIRSGAQLAVASGTVTGTGAVVVDGRLDWNGGNISGSGPITVAASGLLNMSGPGTRTLGNRGLALFGVGTIGEGALAVATGGSFIVRPGARLDVFATGSVLVRPPTGTPGRFVIEGLMRVIASGPASTATFAAPWENHGAVTITASRTLSVSALARLSGAGSWELAADAVLELRGASLDSATVTLEAPGELRGAGQVHVPEGRVALRGAIDLSGRLVVLGSSIVEIHTAGSARLRSLDVRDGELRLFGASPHVVSQLFQWRAGSVGGTGTLHLTDSAFVDLGSLSGVGARSMRGSVTVRVDGRAHLSDGSFSISDSSRVIVGSTGRFEVSNGRAIGSLATGGPVLARLENDGAFVKLDASNTTIALPFINRGSLDLGGGNLEAFLLTNTPTAVLLGAGTIEAGIAGVAVEGVVSPGRVAGGTTTDTLPGRIAINSSVLFSGAPALELDLGGASANAFDVLDVEGSFTAAGTLRVRGIDGYVPTAGDTLEVLRFGSRSGNFTAIAGLDFGVGAGGLALDTVWTSSALLLVARTPAAGGTYRWINPAGGSYSVGSNWNLGVPPSATDTAIIDLAGSYIVTVGADVSIAHLYVGTGSNTPTLRVNSGTLTISDSASFAVGSFLAGAGNIRVLGGGVRLNGGVGFTGRWESQGTRFEIGPGGVKNIDVLVLGNGNLRMLDNAILTVRDTLYWGNASVSGSGNAGANGTLGIANTGFALLTTEHSRELRGGVRLDMDGRLLFGAGTLQLDAAHLEVGPTGTLEVLTAREITGAPSSENLVTIDGRLLGPPGAAFAVNVPVVNRGLIAVRNGGTFSHGASFEHAALARLAGNGTLTLNLVSGSTALSGGFEPGTRPAPGQTGDTIPAQLTVENGGTPITLASSSLVNFALGGTSVANISRLRFTEAVTFAGTLRVSGIGGFLPQPGDRFPIITYSARNGAIPNFLGLDYAVASGGARLDTLWTSDTLFLVGVGGGTAVGESLSWLGAVSDDFHTPANWSRGRVPGPLDTALVQTLAPPIRARSVVRVYRLDLESGVSATFDDTLAVRKSLRSSGSVLLACGGPIVMGDAEIDVTVFEPDELGSIGLAACGIVVQDSYTQFLPFQLSRLELRGSATLDIRSADLIVTGDLVVTDSARMRMDDVDGFVVIVGHAYFGGANSFGHLTDGQLQIGGNLVQTSGTSARSFAPSGNHSTELLGATSSTVRFASPASGESGFHRLAIIKGGGATVTFAESNVRAAEVNVFESDVTIGTGRTFTVGSFTSAGTARFTVQAGAAVAITGTCGTGTIRWTGAGVVSPIGCFLSSP